MFEYNQLTNVNVLNSVLKNNTNSRKTFFKYMLYSILLPQSRRECVGLLDEKPGFKSQARHQKRNTKSISPAKTLRVNKTAMKSF